MDEFFQSILLNLGPLLAEDRDLAMKFIRLTLSKGHHINKANCNVILEWKAKHTNHLLVIDTLRACMQAKSITTKPSPIFRRLYKELIHAIWHDGCYNARVKCTFEDVFAFHFVLYQIWKKSSPCVEGDNGSFENDIITGFWSHVECVK